MCSMTASPPPGLTPTAKHEVAESQAVSSSLAYVPGTPGKGADAAYQVVPDSTDSSSVMSLLTTSASTQNVGDPQLAVLMKRDEGGVSAPQVPPDKRSDSG